jgi:hypothetical protein
VANKLLARDYDQFTGITEETWYDEDAGTITLRRLQDVEHTLAMNKVMNNMHTSKKPSFNDVKGGAYHKARIPFMVVEKWMREEGFNWFKSTDKERRAKLNDSENSKLLVRPGKL